MRVLGAAIVALGLVFGVAAPAFAVGGTPCSIPEGACLRLSTNQAWLIHQGSAGYGPVPVTHGRPGHATPVGTFSVLRKVRNDWSVPYNAPMPYSVYFTRDGVAFHEGSLSVQSHGCVHLSHSAAVVFYDNLFVGEQVQVVR
jgi:lipoprotein-anchoring transpeptidase ErfK/SrfK